MARGWWLHRPPPQHVSEDDLLLHLDGALTGRDEEVVARHLRDCWSCRTQEERLRDAIGVFMEERRAHLRSLEDLQGDPGGFAIRLARAVAQSPGSSARPKIGLRFLGRRLVWTLAATALVVFGAWRPVRDYIRAGSAPTAPSAPAPVPEPRQVEPRRAAAAAILPPVLSFRPAPPPLTVREPPLPARVSGPGAADLDAAELAAHLALHRLGLCRWQAIEAARLPGRSIRITGVAERSDQIAGLKTALAGVSSIEFEVLAPPEDMPALPGDGRNVIRLEPRPPLLQKRLEEYFLRHAPRDHAAWSIAEFCGRATQLSDTAHTEAQALSVLAAAFSEARLHRMSAVDRARFSPMAEEHMRELEQSLAQLRVLLDRLGDETRAVELPPAPPGRWEEWCRLVARRTARMDYLIGGLFAGLDLHGLAGEQAWRELRDAQAQSLALIEAAGPSVHSSLESRNPSR
jgi:hypothetical protein